MKKIKTLSLALVLAGATLAGCDFFSGGDLVINPTNEYGEVVLKCKGGSEDDAQEINDMIPSLISITGSEGAPGANSAYGDKNDFILYADKYGDIDVEWEFDKNSPAIRQITTTKDGNKMIELNYADKGGQNSSFKMRMKSAQLGRCKTEKNQVLDFDFTLEARTLKYDVMRISEIEKVTNGKYNVVNYNKLDTKYPFTENDWHDDGEGGKTDSWLYVKTYGEIIYFSPDGDWGLIGEGDNVIEFFAGNDNPRALITENWPDLKVGNKVMMTAEIQQYKGNLQLSYVNRIEKNPANVTIEDAKYNLSNFREITESEIAGFKVNETHHEQDIDCYANSLRKVTGTVTALRAKSGSYFNAGQRCWVDLKVGNEKFTVEYDYHITNKGKDNTTEATAITNGFRSLKVGDAVTFYGSARYQNDDDQKPYFGSDRGQWTLIPFAANHIVKN